MTRMMKIVPASRLVRDASLEPPSIDRSRAITPAGGAVVDGASVTVTVGIPERVPRGAATIRPINYSLRLGWVGAACNAVIPELAKHEPGISGFPDVQLHIGGSR